MNPGRRTKRKPGPRFSDESHAETAKRLQMAAVAIAETEGLEGLTFTAVAAAPGLNVSRVAPLHYFGTYSGMLAAVAEHAFSELRGHLRVAREAAGTCDDLLERVAMEHGCWALSHGRLYRAIHSATLWQSMARQGLRQGERKASSIEKSNEWLRKANIARDEAFIEITEAVWASQEAGFTRPGDTGSIAGMLTALVDGFVFQSLEEHVGSHLSVKDRRKNLRRIIDLATSGIRVPPA